MRALRCSEVWMAVSSTAMTMLGSNATHRRHHRARPGDLRPLAPEPSMAEHGIDVRRVHRPGLPAIFAGFFWLGVTSFGGKTAAGLYPQIVQPPPWVHDPQFPSHTP